MPQFGGRAKLFSVGGAVLAGVAGVVGVVILASPASAHDAGLTGTAVCQNDGTYTVTYKGDTTNSDLTSTVAVTDSEPADTNVSPMSQSVPGNSSFEITQTGVPGTASTASAKVHVTWSDNFQTDASGTVPLDGTCSKPPTPVTATQPTFTNATCLGPQPTYTIPATQGVQYRENGQNVSAGTHQAQPGDVVTVTAIAEQGYTLTGDTSWPAFTFAAVPTNCANAPTITQPSCTSTSGGYTIPTTKDVTYFVNGSEKKPGTYSAKAGSTVKINAFGSSGQALPGTSSWTFTIQAAPTDCNAHVPTFVDNTCTASGHYTIPNGSVDYTVNDVSVAPGTHSVSAGTAVTIRAIARAGHPLVGPTSWTHSFPNLPQCVAPIAKVNGSGPLANTGPDVPVGQASLLAGVLALIGAGLLFAGRRPGAGGRHSTR